MGRGVSFPHICFALFLFVPRKVFGRGVKTLVGVGEEEQGTLNGTNLLIFFNFQIKKADIWNWFELPIKT